MDSSRLFKKYRNRLVLEGTIKSLICGFIAGFAVNFVIAFVTWFFSGFNGLWLAIGVGAAVAAGCSVLLYFKKFRPTTKQIAERIDGLGLEERIITMAEFENDDSYLAMRQREDAQAALRAVGDRKLRLRVPVAIITAVAVLGVCGIAMTTVTGLSAQGVIASGEEVINKITPSDPDKFLEVSYLVDGEGYIDGEPDQLVPVGGNTTEVEAVPAEGWAFAYWDDGSGASEEDMPKEPVRNEKNVRMNITWTAVFQELGDGDGDGDGDSNEPSDSEEGDEGDKADDEPSDGSDSNDNNSNDDNQGDPSDSDPNDPSNGSGDGAGGSSSNNSQVIDGDTDYRDVYDDFYDQSQGDKDGDDELPDEYKDFIDGYWDTLH
ncbi:MAG: hypothetical protein OSJ83_00840 [Clostridia bacterium]|nr:hypothetical protein [Clostridia bacterium]